MRGRKSSWGTAVSARYKQLVTARDGKRATSNAWLAGWRGGLVYLTAWGLASWVFYLRFPNAYYHPNFYAEDGLVFARNLLQHDFIHAIGTTFNGYYLWGVYILEKLGFWLNSLLFGGEFVNLARSFAIISYLAYGFVATLPILLFRNRLRPMALLLSTLLLVFIPLPGTEYAIIGVISDLKFGFVFIAFCLLMYRHLADENSRLIPLIDLGLLICVYTNTTIYLFLPFALLRYWPKLRSKDRLRQLQDDASFRSLILLGLASLPQLYFIKRDGLAPLPGYLDSPFQKQSTIELFFARSFLFGFLYPVYKSLNNGSVVIIMTAATGLGWWASGKEYRKFFIFGWLAVLASTLLFVSKRPGVSAFHIGYKSGGFDQFFYGQNWIFDFVLAIALVELIARFKRPIFRLASSAFLAWFIITALVPRASSYGKNTFMQTTVGTIYAQAQRACKTNQEKLAVQLYPTPDQTYTDLRREQLCTKSAVNYVPRDYSTDFGLQPRDNTFIQGLGLSTFFTQTFTATDNGLNGIAIYFSTFGQTPHSPYNLTLYESDCKTSLLQVSIPTKRLADNAFYIVRFTEQSSSANKTYCFSAASSRPDNVSPLAIQLSSPGIYPEGKTTINGVLSDRDVVFQPHYR